MYADSWILPMEMRLRPEQWILLGILAAGLTLLALQVGQEWTLPDLNSGQTAATPAQDAAPAGAAADTPQPGPGTPPTGPAPATEAGTAEASGPGLRIRCEPDALANGESFMALASLEGVLEAIEASFTVLFDPGALAYDPGLASPISALLGQGGPPDLEINSPAPERLKVTLRRRHGAPHENAVGDMCGFQFTARRAGRTRLQINGGTILDGGGARLALSDAEVWIDVR